MKRGARSKAGRTTTRRHITRPRLAHKTQWAAQGRSLLIAGAAIGVGALLMLLSLGVRLPIIGAPSTTSPSAGATEPNLTPIVTPGKACSRTSQNDHLFANCPSFLVDFSHQTGDKLDSYEFNTMVGAPLVNSEAQYYTDLSNNLRIANGALFLEARTQAYKGYGYTSARIDTLGKEDFLYGKLVVRASLPSGIGTWPAIWMLPSQPRYAANSPESDMKRYLNDGEIDIAESVGLQPHVVYGVAHSRAYPEDGADRSYYSTTTVANNDHTYHDYEVDWTPTSLTFRIDGKAFYAYHKRANADWRSWPFDQPFYLIINLALGGTWAGSDTLDFPGDGIDKRVLPTAIKVQSIHYYAYAGRVNAITRPASNR